MAKGGGNKRSNVDGGIEHPKPQIKLLAQKAISPFFLSLRTEFIPPFAKEGSRKILCTTQPSSSLWKREVATSEATLTEGLNCPKPQIKLLAQKAISPFFLSLRTEFIPLFPKEGRRKIFSTTQPSSSLWQREVATTEATLTEGLNYPKPQRKLLAQKAISPFSRQ
ncbi:Hypothetical protein I595_1543 [Croceitalea dokdonensis DOKDO 023]|uniref:Uncharacterized protein n=1 Tax=Croceitalea dokdonensis DOKDO 023 TaxID=1300341 RepID=A0A0P7AF50_9FLAO|nr:Hypothetical protein I595_1543 [Croceitalea dokdonensis DOKDO 023]